MARPPPLSVTDSVIWQPFVRSVAVDEITLVQISFPAQSVIDFLPLVYLKDFKEESVAVGVCQLSNPWYSNTSP